MNPKAFPDGVSPTGDIGVYRVTSNTRPLAHLVDLLEMRCDCERDRFRSEKLRRKHGYLKYEEACSHIRLALAYNGMLLAQTIKDGQKKK